ncbi:MAG: 50S ribosomal protein L5 [Candidatus Niyogibacteria bacterium CG10_big_fil_rev_8_21_14_0_10_46_36]|uniref:Large ribosomal subunit protein uL5 n=1 Tax=Candidatus Niyogibacteria bacterium CG10_big_fil_rev_8_21_14_0_10_46_36 TaxID=1974726 RepID=A0A2H0TDY6_9BACT|nr:MAG: 50S ribosomal protein L5 [Candidatus Niyogibacteria bacterium CG10_big_fil_rev_8_21_14_0_10_46_36]
METVLQKQYKKEVIPFFEKEFGYTNPMAIPQLIKVVVNVGVGRRNEEEQKQIVRDLQLIVGQALSPRAAKQSIATFKTRQGQTIGYAATLRGRRMYDFLERIIAIALPRTRDFRGLKDSAIDQSGNLTIGIPEHIVFPEMVGEDTKLIFGFEITIVTSAQSKEEAQALFTHLGFPFRKEQETK